MSKRKVWEFDGEVVRVIDGDTLVVRLDLGFMVSHTVSVRLKGIDAPEIFSGPDEEKTRGWHARRVVEWWVATNRAEVHVVTSKGARSFNRYVAEVWPIEGGQSLNETLVQMHPDLFTSAD